MLQNERKEWKNLKYFSHVVYFFYEMKLGWSGDVYIHLRHRKEEFLNVLLEGVLFHPP